VVLYQIKAIPSSFTSISLKANFKLHNAFADKDENPDSEWDYNFSEKNGITRAMAG